MTRRIEREIRQNRRDARRLESYFRQPAPDQTVQLRLPLIDIEVEVTATVSTRPLNDTAIAGHPDAAHGAGRGAAGDQRGSWSQAEQTTDGEFVEDGRSAVVDALTGVATGLDAAEAGSGTGAASAADTDLEAGAGRVHAWHETPATDTTRGAAWFRFQEFGDVVNEVGLFDDDGSLVARLTTSGVDPAADEELKLELDLAFSAATTGDAAVTELASIAHAIASPFETVGLDQVAIGTDGTSPTASDTALGNQVIQKAAATTATAERVSTYTIVFRGEPSTQPHDVQELGVFDEAGTLLWRIVFDAETKDDRVRMRPQSGVRIN